MVLSELGSRLTGALRKMANATVIDDAVVDATIKEVCTALLEADVNIALVAQLKRAVKQTVTTEGALPGINKRKLIHRAIFDQLCALLDPKSKPFAPKKGSANIIMFVGLQGAGKTTTVTKLAYYYARKGWKVGLVCADTFRAGAFDQLKQNAAKAKVPFYGSHTETDPVKIAHDGVAKFKKEGFEIIIVDTSGRHKQEKALFDEMQQVYLAVKPQDVVFVLDASIGQAAAAQASAFKDQVKLGSVVITKLDGHAKGGGALSAVAQTGCPITFIGTGEHMYDMQSFDTQSFVRRLLGLGDLKGLVDVVKDVGLDQQTELMERLQQGVFTLRDMRDQLTNVMKAGPISNIMSMIPGMSADLFPAGREQEGQARIKRFLYIMDSMTDEELDSKDVAKLMTASRIERIARGAGRHIREAQELMEMFKQFQKAISKMKNLKMPGMGAGGPRMGAGGMPSQAQMNALSQMIDPRMLQQMGGMQGIQSMMKQFSGMDLGALGGMLPGFGKR
nr:signal recognition particle 54 kDa protein [Andalucia godoyi]|eukprot:ANDGO_04612.mRNA.1 Signal recognition particle 54 kDa protein 2